MAAAVPRPADPARALTGKMSTKMARRRPRKTGSQPLEAARRRLGVGLGAFERHFTDVQPPVVTASGAAGRRLGRPAASTGKSVRIVFFGSLDVKLSRWKEANFHCLAMRQNREQFGGTAARC